MPRTKIVFGDGIGTYDQQTLGAGASKVAALSSDDDDTSYTYSTGDWRQTLTTSVPGDLAAITAHTLTVKIRRSTVWDGFQLFAWALLRHSSTDYLGTARSIAAEYDWKTYQEVGLGGATLTKAQADTVEIGSRIGVGNAGQQGRCSYVEWDITYTVRGGAYAQIIGCLGPLVAVGIRELPGLAKEVLRRTGVLILPHEYRAALREMRERRWLVAS